MSIASRFRVTFTVLLTVEELVVSAERERESSSDAKHESNLVAIVVKLMQRSVAVPGLRDACTTDERTEPKRCMLGFKGGL